MTPRSKKSAVRTAVGSLSGIVVFIILLLHNAWGDERYELKAEAIEKQIHRIDTEMTIIDQEILFAESDKQKAKFIAIKAIYEREKETLTRKIKTKG